MRGFKKLADDSFIVSVVSRVYGGLKRFLSAQAKESAIMKFMFKRK